MFSCIKEDGISEAEQSILDNTIIIEYLGSHKIDSTSVHLDNHINWTIIKANSGDETLADIALKNSITSGGVVYYYYYVEIEEGKNIDDGTSSDLMIVDFNEYLLDDTMLSTSEKEDDAMELEISSRITGVKTAITKHFFTGVIPSANVAPNYRLDTDVPGRGIIIFPSGLGYKDASTDKISSNQPLRIDLVLYTKTNFPEEEK